MTKLTEKMFEKLKKDKGYRIGWQANIAMAFENCYSVAVSREMEINFENIHAISNAAANYFLDLLCDNLEDCAGDGAFKETCIINKYLDKELKNEVRNVE